MLAPSAAQSDQTAPGPASAPFAAAVSSSARSASPAPAHVRPTKSTPRDQPSLLRDLADGSAGPVVRLVASLALAPIIAGAGLLASYALAGFVPAWSDRGYNWAPRDELVASVMALSILPYLAGLAWIWTRTRRPMHEFWKAGVITAGIGIVTIILGVAIDSSQMLRGGFDVLFGAITCFASAAVILIWLRAARRFTRGRSLINPADGAADIRCPTCGYRMVGLHESRCPECGTAYTLDELVARQNFRMPARAEQESPPTNLTNRHE